MALKTAYATATIADTYLADKADWLALTAVVKAQHLLNATYYIDANYSCVWATPIQDEAAYACTLLAYHDFITGIYKVDPNDGNAVVESEVVAMGVKSRKKFSGSNATGRQGYVDKYPDVTAILGGICSINKSGFSQLQVVR